MSKKKNNLWMIRFNDKFEFNIVKSILNKGTNVSLLVGNHITEELLKKIDKKYSSDLEFINNNKITALKQEKKKSYKLNYKTESFFFKSNLYKYYYTALQILERNERWSGELSFEERNFILYKQVEYWQNKIEEKCPTHVIFFDIPHVYYEQIILAICDEKNIPCMFLSSSNNNTLFVNNKNQLVSGYGGKKFSDINREYFKKIQDDLSSGLTFQHKSKKFLTFKDVWFSLFKLIYHFFLSRRIEYQKGYFIKKKYFNFGYNNLFNQSYNLFLYNLNCLRMKYFYKKISHKADYNCDYVYMPLVGGYEATMHPVASPVNYFIIIDYLKSILPQNYYIYIKEHPAQFLYRYHQRFARSKEFYTKIQIMDRIRFIKLDENNLKLISKSKFVVGSSGSSTAIEAVALKKIYKYYGTPRNSNKYIEPLFKTDDTINRAKDTNAYHEECKYRNVDSDAESLGKKIILWANDN